MKEAIAAAHREAADGAPHNGDSEPPRRPRGRPPKPGSRRDVARRTGISPREQLLIEQHVALGTQYPLFQNARWTRADALKARSLLKALTDDQCLEVARELADLDAPSALRLLQTRGTPLSGVVPVQSAATSGSQSQATKRSAAAMHGAATATAAGTLATPLPRLLVIAKALVLHAAGRLQNPTLRERLQQVAGDLQLIVVQLRRAAPAPAAAGVVRIPIASVLRVIEKAKALVLQAAQRSLDPELQGRLRHVAAEIEALLVQLPPHADNGRSRS